MTFICFFKGVRGSGVKYWTQTTEFRDLKKISIPEDVDGFYFYDTFDNSTERYNISKMYYRRGMILSKEEYDKECLGTYVVNNTRGHNHYNPDYICSCFTEHKYLLIEGDKIFE